MGIKGQNASPLPPTVEMGAWNPRVAVAALFGLLLFFATGGVVAVSSPDLSDLSEVLGWLEQLGSLDADTQRAMLHLFGQQMVDSGVTKCNVFGGRESCIDLDPSSKFAHSCVNYPLKVDCAFYRGALAEQDEDPTSELEAEVEAQKATMCDGCNANLKDLYCAQTVPPCGSFQDHIELAIVPPLQRIVQGQIDGDNIADAVAKEVPNLVKTLALVAPCRRYCEAITIIVRVRSEDHNRPGARFEQDEEHPARASRRNFLRAALRAGQGYALVRPLRGRDGTGVLGTLPEGPKRLDRRHVRLVLGQQRDPNLRGGTPRRRTHRRRLGVVDRARGVAGGRRVSVPGQERPGDTERREGTRTKPRSQGTVVLSLARRARRGGCRRLFGLRAFRRFREERGGFRHEYTRADFLEEDEGEYTAAVDLDEL